MGQDLSWRVRHLPPNVWSVLQENTAQTDLAVFTAQLVDMQAHPGRSQLTAARIALPARAVSSSVARTRLLVSTARLVDTQATTVVNALRVLQVLSLDSMDLCRVLPAGLASTVTLVSRRVICASPARGHSMVPHSANIAFQADLPA